MSTGTQDFSSLLGQPNGAAQLNASGSLVGPVLIYADTAANLAALVPLAKQQMFATDTHKFVVGDGITTFADLEGGPYLPLSGGTMSGPLDMGTHDITNGGAATFSDLTVMVGISTFSTVYANSIQAGPYDDLTITGGLGLQVNILTSGGNISLGGGNISGGGTVTATTFAGAVTGHASLDLPLSGGTMSGPLDMGTHDITNGGAARFSGKILGGDGTDLVLAGINIGGLDKWVSFGTTTSNAFNLGYSDTGHGVINTGFYAVPIDIDCSALNIQTISHNPINFGGVIFPQQAATASAPAYGKGGIYFDTTLNKLRIGGASGWETVTSV